jgi:tetraacyldisaccharide 4'-kinase
LHAVSVGEVLAAIPLLTEIKKRAPLAPLFVSTTTLAGRSVADKRLVGIADGVFFAPIDFVWVVRRVLRRLRPSVVIVLETEIWPNLFRESKRRGCALVIVNGRISDRALPRYRKFSSVFSCVLDLCDRILTQSDEMRRRFIEAGARSDSVEVGGNLKYDFVTSEIPLDSPAMHFIRAVPDRPLWIAASTTADDRLQEEDPVIEAQRGLPGWRLILAPRKPERFEEVARKLDAARFHWSLRSEPGDPAADVLLLDSIGELSALFAHANVVFMGGTIADRGGHNILEPAVFGKPVIAGPHLENFREIAEHFEQSNALLRIKSGDELGDAILTAAADSELGNRARAAARQECGAAIRAADLVMMLYDSTYPRLRPPQPVHALLWALSMLWKAGNKIDGRRKQARVRRLPVPVVSVGNITAGGTGKTPMVMELLRDFRSWRPGVLTRGYGRNTSEDVLLLEGDDYTMVSRTGDEAILCHRVAHVPTGIGADRYATGTQLLTAADLRMLFLDDGYQHLQLYRNFNLVLIDGIDPFGGGHLLPLGRLREPLEGLARAHAFVITHMRETPNSRAIESVLQRYNPAAPLFHARINLRHWTASDGGRLEPDALSGVKAVGFCGLGNPESFWRSLRRTNLDVLDRHAFDDHHRYPPAEIRRLARNALDIGADALVTTAKDAVNLDPDYASIVAPLKLYWLEIGLDIDRRQELIELIRAAC